MWFGKERRKVARVIRDMVVRPRPDLSTADGDLGGGLGVLARLVAAPFAFAPQAATRIPQVLRELGERRRAIPPRRRVAPDPSLALQALKGCFSADDSLRTRYLNLLAAAMDRATARQVHPGFVTVLRQLTADETRIFSRFEGDGPYPVLTVQSRPKHGGSRHTELRHFSLLGEQSGCEHPARTPLYLDNLCRLGLTELRPTKLSEDTRMFKPLEQHPNVAGLVAGIGQRAPAAAGDGQQPGDPLVADLQYKYLFVTSFGRQFYEACEYRPEAEM
jgi:hypothetical protein